MYAQVENLETCSAPSCVQPVETDLGHLADGGVVMLGYCAYHAFKVTQRRLAGLSDFPAPKAQPA